MPEQPTFTEDQWDQAAAIARSYTNLAWFPRDDAISVAITQLVADGGAPQDKREATEEEIESAVKYVNRFMTDGRKHSFESSVGDMRFWLVAALQRSLRGQEVPAPVSPTPDTGASPEWKQLIGEAADHLSRAADLLRRAQQLR